MVAVRTYKNDKTGCRVRSSPWLDRLFLVKLCQKANFGSISPTTSPFWELKVALGSLLVRNFIFACKKSRRKTQWVAGN